MPAHHGVPDEAGLKVRGQVQLFVQKVSALLTPIWLRFTVMALSGVASVTGVADLRFGDQHVAHVVRIADLIAHREVAD